MRAGMRMGGGGGVQFTPLTKMLLMFLVGLFIAQKVLESFVGFPMLATFGWMPFGQGFQPWQPFTGWFLNGSVMRAFFDWLFLFFILPAVEPMFTLERLKRFAFFTYFGSIIVGFLMLLTGIVHINGVWFGIEPFLAALLVLFGLSRPNATILLMFIIPIKAAWVAWGSGLLCLLNLLDGRSLDSAMWLAGWISGYIWLKGGMSGGLKKVLLRYKQRRIKQRLSTFDVIDGGKGWGNTPGGDDTVH